MNAAGKEAGTASRLIDIIAPDGVMLDIPARSQDEVLQAVADRLARSTGLESSRIQEALAAREELGSTGVGYGVALPHAWIPEAARLTAVFARPAQPIDWHAVDAAPVEFVFAVVGPDNAAAGVSALAAITRVVRRADTLAKLRSASRPENVRGFFEKLASAA
jgi:PTS system nitrogen regulatory IIA component